MRLQEFLKEDACGDCFKVAGRNMIHSEWDDVELVHGTVTNIEGKTFLHAWNEHRGMVIDNSQGRPMSMPIKKYYELMQVANPTKYSRLDAIRRMARNKHWGPWE